jgi:hypothetical protein
MPSCGQVHSVPHRSISCSYIDPKPDENQTGSDPDQRKSLNFGPQSARVPGQISGIRIWVDP